MLTATTTDRKDEIAEKATDIFLSRGVKSPTMDDIASAMRISKKTLYKHFRDKTDLITYALIRIIDAEKQAVQSIFHSHTNAIEAMLKFSQHVTALFGNIKTEIKAELKAHYPSAYALLEDFEYDFMASVIENNIRHGMDEGLYRKNLNPYLIARFFTSKIHYCTDPRLNIANHFTLGQIHSELMRYHLLGIVSQQGLQSMEKRIELQ
ncbi:MAG: TetR/AcrR family transcriptional regulator [Salibacteraceae bacterium]